MREDLDTFDNALPRDDGDEGVIAMPHVIKRRKTFGEVTKFWALNIVIAPLLFMLCLAVAAQGIRELVSVMRTRLYRLPFPGIENLRDYQGFSDLDLSHIASGLLFVAVTFIWVRVISESKGYGEVMGYRESSPLAFYLYASIAAIILIADAFVFYVGLAAKSNAWNETPWYVPIACTLLYAAGVAAFAALHQSYHQPNRV